VDVTRYILAVMTVFFCIARLTAMFSFLHLPLILPL